jgi:NAD(P)-dependent dehydrogenase (short-subunit alcohol dehydrogenase family)
MIRDLEGKTALVTGAGRGMGRGIAERLAEAGALVGLLDAQPVDAAIAAIEAKGGRAFHVQAEIGPPGGTEAMIAGLDAGLGGERLDILVNNIGGGVYEPFEATTIERLDWSWNLNVRILFLVTTALIPRLRDGGRVINISSAGSRIADPAFVAYGMAKAAVDYFTRALAKQLGPRGIAVNAVAPGTTNVDTNFEALRDPAVVEFIAKDTAMGRIGQPRDIAEVIHMLASPAGRWVTGQIVDASGGYKL